MWERGQKDVEKLFSVKVSVGNINEMFWVVLMMNVARDMQCTTIFSFGGC